MVKFLVFVAGVIAGHVMTLDRLGLNSDMYHDVLVGEAEVRVQDVASDGKAEGV